HESSSGGGTAGRASEGLHPFIGSLTVSTVYFCYDTDMASSAPETDVGSDVVLHLLGLMAAMHDHFHACISEFDLTASQADALRNLGEPQSQRDLAQRLKFDASNVTAIVDRLEERGLVERRVDPGDR